MLKMKCKICGMPAPKLTEIGTICQATTNCGGAYAWFNMAGRAQPPCDCGSQPNEMHTNVCSAEVWRRTYDAWPEPPAEPPYGGITHTPKGKPRYEMHTGKYGHYYRDGATGMDLTIDQVLALLNESSAVLDATADVEAAIRQLRQALKDQS